MGVFKSEKRVRLPKGGDVLSAFVESAKNKRILGSAGVTDVLTAARKGFLQKRDAHYDGELADLLGAKFGVKFDQFLAFRKVEEHADDWHKVEDSKGKRSAAGFLQVVVHGGCRVKAGGVEVELRRGDVFVLNPNRLHEVLSRSLCVTVVADIAWKERTLYL